MGLRINTAKTKVMSWNKSAGRKVQVDGEELEAVSKSDNLGVQRFNCSVIRMGNMAYDLKRCDLAKPNHFLLAKRIFT